MREPIRFLLSAWIRRFIRPVAYKYLPSIHGKKVQVILKLKKKHRINVFVETGTYLGDTIDSVVRYFHKIYSIELDEKLFKRAKAIFRNDRNVKLIFGDSSTKIKDVLGDLAEPALFWLDAHYSGDGTAKGKTDTPVNSELGSVLKHKVTKHIILIDDARLFNGKNGYPEISNLRRKIGEDFPMRKFSVKDDIILIE